MSADQQELDRLANLPGPPVTWSPAARLNYFIKQTLAKLPTPDSPPDVPSNPREHLPSELSVGQTIVDGALLAAAPSEPTTDMSVPLGLSPHRGFIAPGSAAYGRPSRAWVLITQNHVGCVSSSAISWSIASIRGRE